MLSSLTVSDKHCEQTSALISKRIDGESLSNIQRLDHHAGAAENHDACEGDDS